MDRGGGGRGIRRSRGGRPFIRGFYRGRTRIRRPTGYWSRTSNSRDKYEYNDNDRSDSRERSWGSRSGSDTTRYKIQDTSKEKRNEEDTSPVNRSKWDKDEETNEKNDERYIDKKDYYHDSKYYKRPTGYYRGRGQRRPYQNNYWDRSDRGRHHSPQSQYRTRPYHSPPRHRRYSRSPDRRQSPSRYRSRSHSPSRSRHYSPTKQRSPKRRSPSRRLRSPSEADQSIEKDQAIQIDSDGENNSDDFVEKLKASKSSKTPGRVEYSEKSNDEYWIESDKNNAMDTKKANRPDYFSKGSKTPSRTESSNKGSRTPGRPESSNKGSKTPGRQEIFSKGSKTPSRPELINTDNDDYWVKSQTSKPSTKNLYSSSWDDSPVRENSVPKVPKTPGRKDYSTINDDSWIDSPPHESIKDRLSNETRLKKKINKDSSTMYVEELSSSDSEQEKNTKRARSMSLTNSDKSDTPPLNKEQSIKLESQYSRNTSRGSNVKSLKEPPPPSIPATPSNAPAFNSQWSDIQNASTYSSTTNYVQPQSSQFGPYQQRNQVSVSIIFYILCLYML